MLGGARQAEESGVGGGRRGAFETVGFAADGRRILRGEATAEILELHGGRFDEGAAHFLREGAVESAAGASVLGGARQAEESGGGGGRRGAFETVSFAAGGRCILRGEATAEILELQLATKSQ